jgi:hypothetical protein
VETQKTSEILLFTGIVDEYAVNLTTKPPFLDLTFFGDAVAAFAFLATQTFPIKVVTCQMARQGGLDKACCFTGMFPHVGLTIKALLLTE